MKPRTKTIPKKIYTIALPMSGSNGPIPIYAFALWGIKKIEIMIV